MYLTNKLNILTKVNLMYYRFSEWKLMLYVKKWISDEKSDMDEDKFKVLDILGMRFLFYFMLFISGYLHITTCIYVYYNSCYTNSMTEHVICNKKGQYGFSFSASLIW